MSSLTLDLPEDLVARLGPHKERISQILELGLREVIAASQPGFEGSAEVLEFLAGLPTPEEILAYRPTPQQKERVSALLEKNRSQGLTDEEEREWERYQYLEHLMRIAKAKAHRKLKAS